MNRSGEALVVRLGRDCNLLWFFLLEIAPNFGSLKSIVRSAIFVVIRLNQMHNESLIPKHKSDIATAEAAIRLGHPAVTPILAKLIFWLQDYNWPVARILSPFLASIGLPLIPHIDVVFATDDDIWKYWMISCLIGESEPLFLHYKDEIIRIANHPTKRERHQELDDVAQDAIEKWMAAP